MLNTLVKIFDDGGRLVDVTYALFEGDPQFITAVGLNFSSLTVIFRAGNSVSQVKNRLPLLRW
jgi:hypothetical protein